MHILADARPLPERGPIIDQDPHARGIVAQCRRAPAGDANSLLFNKLTMFFSLC